MSLSDGGKKEIWNSVHNYTNRQNGRMKQLHINTQMLEEATKNFTVINIRKKE